MLTLGNILAWLRSHLSRITTSGNFIPEIDGMRFLAIFGVIVSHVNGLLHYHSESHYQFTAVDRHVARLCELGAFGVPLFFMISGFILALPFVEYCEFGGRKPSLPGYYLRRLTRLEPPYMISMVLFFGGGIVAGKYNLAEHWNNFVASMFYVHNLVFNSGSLINNNAWSLEIEIQFYVLVPLVVTVFRIGPRWRRPLLVFAMLVGSWLAARHSPTAPQTILRWAQYFFGGFLLADIYTHELRFAARPSFGFDAVAVGAGVCFLALNLTPAAASFAGYAMPFVFLLYGLAVFRGRVLRRLHRATLVTIAGGMCYSVYLLHARIISVPVALIFSRQRLTGSYWADVIVLVSILAPLVFAVSALFFVAVERPCMKKDWPARLMARATAWVKGPSQSV